MLRTLNLGHLVPPGGRRLSGSTGPSHKDTIQMEQAAEGERRAMGASARTETAQDGNMLDL